MTTACDSKTTPVLTLVKLSDDREQSPSESYPEPMGEFIQMGISIPKHKIDFLTTDGACVLSCECGWQSEIVSYPNSWALVEMNTRIRRHLADFGLDDSGATGDGK